MGTSGGDVKIKPTKKDTHTAKFTVHMFDAASAVEIAQTAGISLDTVKFN